jgi:hypothetical protein
MSARKLSIVIRITFLGVDAGFGAGVGAFELGGGTALLTAVPLLSAEGGAGGTVSRGASFLQLEAQTSASAHVAAANVSKEGDRIMESFRIVRGAPITA